MEWEGKWTGSKVFSRFKAVLQRAGNSARAYRKLCNIGHIAAVPVSLASTQPHHVWPRIMYARAWAPCIFPPVWAFPDTFRFHMPEVSSGRFSYLCSFHCKLSGVANRKRFFPCTRKADFSAPGLKRPQLTPLLVKAQAIAPLPCGQVHPQLLPNLEQKRSNELFPHHEPRKFLTAGQRIRGPIILHLAIPGNVLLPTRKHCLLQADSFKFWSPLSECHHDLQLSICPELRIHKDLTQQPGKWPIAGQRPEVSQAQVPAQAGQRPGMGGLGRGWRRSTSCFLYAP